MGCVYMTTCFAHMDDHAMQHHASVCGPGGGGGGTATYTTNDDFGFGQKIMFVIYRVFFAGFLVHVKQECK